MQSDLEAIAHAYCLIREIDAPEAAARTEAERVYRERHPEAGSEVGRIVSELIRKARLPGLLW
jgi:hypothetical protein